MPTSEHPERLRHGSGGGGHLSCPEMAALVKRWPVMWVRTIPDIGHLTCYGAPACIVHVMDYFNIGGWDVYVPPTQSLGIAETISSLRRIALVSETAGRRDGGLGMCKAEDLDPGDRVLMMDRVTWQTVERIKSEGVRLIVTYREGGFGTHHPDEFVPVHKEGADVS